MTNCQDIENYFQFVKNLTIEAGDILKNTIHCEKSVEIKGEHRDLVTEHDRAIQKILISGLNNEFPDHKFIAEESYNKDDPPELSDDPTWIIDPIDGTTNFVHGFSQCCISIGLVINKQVELGIIYNPCSDELYTAKRMEGAFLNGNKIKVSSITELSTALIITEPGSIKWAMKNRDIAKARIEALTIATEGIRSIGSACLSMAYVARGVIDALQMDGLKPWDVAAGYLLIKEAGGSIIDTKGGAFNIMEPMMIAAGTESLANEISRLMIDSDLQTQRKRLKRT